MRYGALVLAAGASARLGRPKQLVIFEGESLLERSVRIAREADCDPVIVVLGADEDLIRRECKLQNVLIVSNLDWQEGMGTSLSQGARQLEGARGAIVMTCDMPAVTAAHLRALAASGDVTASTYATRKGVPAYFPRSSFERLIALRGETGAKELLRSAASMELHGGELDIDTPGDLARLEAELRAKTLLF
jgi:molybdenum cofactor cytidylyltransferase